MNNKTYLRGFIKICFCLLFPAGLVAQTTSDTTIINRIKNEALTHSSIPQLAYYLTDVCGSRLTNSPGYRKAMSWAVQQFRNWQIKAAQEAWGEYGKGWSNEGATLQMKAPYYEPMIAYALPWTNGTNGTLTANLILLPAFDSAAIDKAGDNLKGKIVLTRKRDTLLPPSLESDAWRYADSDLATMHDREMMPDAAIAGFKAQVQRIYNLKRYLQQKGAVALLRGTGRDGTVFVSSYLGYAKGYENTLPEMTITSEDHLKLQRFAEHGQTVTLNMKVENRLYTDDLTGYNVIAEIPGTDPVLKNEVVMMGAHLDSWTSGTGATDNGAGCTVMMEVMRILKTLNLQPKRTIRLALWGGEEQVIRGSVGYVKNHFADPADMKPKPEHARISAYYNLDNGTGKIRGIYTMGNDSVKNLFAQWLQPFKDMGAATVTSHSSGGSDHQSFDAVGIPAFPFIQDPMDYDTRTHHSNMDVYERLSMDDLKQCAAIVATFVYNTAMQKDLLPRKPLPQPGSFRLENGLLP